MTPTSTTSPDPASLTPPLIYTGGFAETNGYALRTPDGWLGVDAPEGFAAWLGAQGVKLQALLLTHAHFDHVVDAAEIHRSHGCPIYAWERSTVETRLETYLWEAAGMKFEVEDYPVQVLLAGKSSIQAAGVTFALAHIPGHSLDSVVFMDTAGGRVFTGDTLMQGTMGRTDFPGGSTPMLIHGMRTHLLTLPDDTMVYAGHGDPTTIRAERRWLK
jgi:glyoxylase-like metal-dependent hydrolase (beta-lactamase superfamily II)